jgi:hypothetical protein
MNDAHDIAVEDAINTDFGDSVEYEQPLSEEQELRYAERFEDYAAAQAEAEASQQDLSAG